MSECIIADKLVVNTKLQKLIGSLDKLEGLAIDFHLHIVRQSTKVNPAPNPNLNLNLFTYSLNGVNFTKRIKDAIPFVVPAISRNHTASG